MVFYFSIHDNGTRISEPAQQPIFDQFFQGDPSHSKAGNGLSLSIVKRICVLYDASISVISELNNGSTFTIQFFKYA